jgi:hypothetical protein
MPDLSRQPVEISIIIVNYKTHDLLEQCLKSVVKHLGTIKAEIFVVDNNSGDGSSEMVRDHFRQVHLIANKVNVGYARANNQALRLVQGDYVLLLNSDTIIYSDTLPMTLAYMHEHRDVGALTCKIEKLDGTLDLACRRSFPTPMVAFWRLLGLSYVFPKSRYFAKYNLTYLDENKIYEVDAVVGAFMLINRQALLQVGLLDESFFMYGEDLDWCYRFRQEGYKVVYYPEVKILHHKGASSLNRRAPAMIREFHRAMHLFYRKYFSREHFFFTNWVIQTGVNVHCRMEYLRSKETTLPEKLKLALWV